MNCYNCKIPLTKDNAYSKGKNRPNDFQSHCKSCFNSYCIERWRKLKIEAVAYKGGKCQKCNGEFHPSVFEFHHRDPEGKDMSWTKMKLVSKSKRKAELDKCDLLCANCHRLTHWALSN